MSKSTAATAPEASADLQAQILVGALPYIQAYDGKIIVVKYGGSAMVNDEGLPAVLRDIILLTKVGIKVVLVHGGGKEITETLKLLQQESRFVDGMRYTDESAMKIVQMVLAGRINKELVKQVHHLQAKAIGLCGLDGNMIQVKPLDFARYGYVGDIVRIDPTLLLDTLEKGYIPIVASIGTDQTGYSYNVNADVAASRIADSLAAENFILMSDVAGLLRDKDDSGSLIERISLSEAIALKKESNVIQGGMIPKVDCCIAAVSSRVRKAVILDGRKPHALIQEILTDSGSGTLFYKEDADDEINQ